MSYIEDTQIKNGSTSRVRCWTTASGGWRAHLVRSSAPKELPLSSRPGRTAGPAAQRTTVPSIKAVLEPRMIIQPPLAGDDASHGLARIGASSH
jgi:hypothetical protein